MKTNTTTQRPQHPPRPRHSSSSSDGGRHFAQHLSGAGQATQEAGGPQGPKRPPRPDADGDGVLNDAELSKMAERHSRRTGETVTVDELKAKFDANGDGTVSTDELPTPKGPPPREGPATPPSTWSNEEVVPPTFAEPVDEP